MLIYIEIFVFDECDQYKPVILGSTLKKGRGKGGGQNKKAVQQKNTRNGQRIAVRVLRISRSWW